MTVPAPALRAPAPVLPDAPLPISVLTGFLGSGKTTLLSRVLGHPGFADTAVIVNEFGTVALDHLLLEVAEDGIAVLPNGCVCCAVKQDLADTLYSLLRRRGTGLPAFRRVALETSGLAEPGPILYTLSADAFLEHALRLDTVAATVDALAGADTLDRFPEATAQAATADRLLLTKTDLAEPSPALLGRLATLNPLAAVMRSADAAPDTVLFGGAAPVRPAPGRFAAAAVHAHGIRAHAVALRRPMTRLQFAVALGGLAREHGTDLLRVKGLVAFADRDGGPAAVHAVQHTMFPPRWLPDWPDADRTSRLVFIVRDLPAPLLLDRFAPGDPALL